MSLSTHAPIAARAWGNGLARRALPEETAIAVVVNGTTQAVMMGTPADLEAFGLGFALTERIIASGAEVERLEVVDHDLGLEVRLWVREERAAALRARRRQMAGPTGCGLCGIESLEEARHAISPVRADLHLRPAQVLAAMNSLWAAQELNRETHAVHAAALWQPDHGLVAACEDVGRHNALDKLVGRVAQTGLAAGAAALLLTSRVSIEMVQKAAVLGTPVIVAVSAPTLLAVRTAAEAGLTLVGVARGDGFEVFTHPERIVFEDIAAEETQPL